MFNAAGRGNAGKMIQHDRVRQREHDIGILDEIAERIKLHVPAMREGARSDLL